MGAPGGGLSLAVVGLSLARRRDRPTRRAIAACPGSPRPWRRFLAGLRSDADGGPPPGAHNFFRGGPARGLRRRDPRRARRTRRPHRRHGAAAAVWDAALRAEWRGPPVWFHGDVAAGNLLVGDGRLAAVIDFGTSGRRRPACDLVIAWTLFDGESREAFRAALPPDEAAWARGRGWALWKALITLARHIGTNPIEAAKSRRFWTRSSPITPAPPGPQS